MISRETPKPSPIRAWLVRGIGLVLFSVILSRVDYRGAFRLMRAANPLTLGAAFLLIFPMVAVKTLRWRQLQRLAGLGAGNFETSYLAYLSGMYAGLVTPGRVGEFLRVKYLTDAGAPLGPAMSTVLWDRLIDVGGLFFMGLLALAPLAGDFASLFRILVGLAVLLALGTPLVLRGGGALGRRSRGWVAQRVEALGGLGRKFREVGAGLATTLDAIGPGAWLSLVGLTLVGWVVYYLQAWLLARALGIGLGLFPLLVSVTVAAVAAFLPVSISGLGTRDAAMIVLFQRFGSTGEQAVALSALVFVVLIANALLGLLATQRLGRLTRVGAGIRIDGPGAG